MQSSGLGFGNLEGYAMMEGNTCHMPRYAEIGAVGLLSESLNQKGKSSALCAAIRGPRTLQLQPGGPVRAGPKRPSSTAPKETSSTAMTGFTVPEPPHPLPQLHPLQKAPGPPRPKEPSGPAHDRHGLRRLGQVGRSSGSSGLRIGEA